MSDSVRIPGSRISTAADLDAIDFAKDGGCIIVVAQDADDGRVLMIARADSEAMQRTLETGTMWYRSRTRGLWHKGATSGNVQRVVELRTDCDGDAVLALVRPSGPACHTGEVTCFGAYSPDTLSRLDATIDARSKDGTAADSYTARLLGDRNLRLKKLGEESTELALACTDGDPGRAAEEAADLIYHTAVALHGAGASLSDALRVLAGRER